MTVLRILRYACIMLCFSASLNAQWLSSGGNTTTTDKVGIGTNNPPSSILELSATAPIETIRYTDPANYGCLYFYEAANPVGVLQYVGSSYGAATYRNALMLINWAAGPDIFFTSGVERMRIDASGNMGIGTTAPTRPLSFANATGEKLSLYSNSSAAQDYYGFGIAGAELQYQVPATAHHAFYSGTAEKVRIDAAGNVGVGTTTPAARLDVTDAIYAGTRIAVGQQTSVLRAGYNSFYYSEISSYIPAGAPGVDSIGWKIRPYYYPLGGRFDAVTVTPAGKVGVGVDPTATLDVNGTQHVTGNLSVGSPAGSAAGLHAADIQGAAVLNPSSGGPAREVLGIYDTTPVAAGVGGGIAFGGKFNSSGTIAQQFASIQGIKENGNDGDYASALTLLTRVNNANPQEQVRIASNGNVAIGCPYPCASLVSSASRLNVTGNLAVSGTISGGVIYATYQDVAEWVPAAETMPAGTVVVVSEVGDNTVTASMHAYDTSVAGVVSANPGMLLGIASASKAKIATAGRVRVRVDATKSPIRKGDLLVTSDRPGMAMKSEPLDVAGVKLHRPGTLIGKALEPLMSGEGEILVLLSLQ